MKIWIMVERAWRCFFVLGVLGMWLTVRIFTVSSLLPEHEKWIGSKRFVVLFFGPITGAFSISGVPFHGEKGWFVVQSYDSLAASRPDGCMPCSNCRVFPQMAPVSRQNSVASPASVTASMSSSR